MSLRLAAPYPAIEVISYYPSPEFGDSERLTAEVEVNRTFTNDVYTFVKTKADRRHLQFTVNMTRSKSLELREFVLHYFDKEIEVTDAAEQRWRAFFMTNPFEFESTGVRVFDSGLSDRTITLDFEGMKL